MDLSLDTYYGQTSQLLFGNCGGTQQTAPQTPQTPSSIPDIVLQGIVAINFYQTQVDPCF